MINKGILQRELTNKFNTLTLHCIVNECFIGGLPLDHSEISDEDKRMLTKYSYSVLEQLGGFQLLENAFRVESAPAKQFMFLADMYDICTEAASASKKRICEETDCSNPKTNLKEVVDSATMTDAEYKAFVKKADTMDISQVSEVIKKKTLDVLQNERDQMEKDEELDNELKEALAKTDGMEGVTTESYLDMFLDKSSPRHPLTLFSRLNDAAMEVSSITPISDIEHIAPVLYRTTFEAFLPDLKSSKKIGEGLIAQEGMHTVSTEEMCPVSEGDRPKLSLLVSTIVYTIMETLKTLHLYSPDKDAIRNYVTSRISSQTIDGTSLDELFEKANQIIRENITVDYSKLPTDKLNMLSENTRKLSSRLQNRLAPDDVTSITNITISDKIASLDAITSKITEILAFRNKKAEPAQESYYEKRNRSQLIADFNRVNMLCGQNPNVSEILLKVNPDMPSCIAVEGMNAMHAICKESYIAVEAAVEVSQYADYLKSAYSESKLSKCGKPVYLVEMDGRGIKNPL